MGINFQSYSIKSNTIVHSTTFSPYWAKIDLRYKGIIMYAELNESHLNNSQHIFDIVNSYITDTVLKQCPSVYRARWILAVRWINVCPDGNPNCVSYRLFCHH